MMLFLQGFLLAIDGEAVSTADVLVLPSGEQLRL